MNLPMVVYLIGRLLTAEGLMLVIPAIVSAIYGEQKEMRIFLAVAVLTIFIGIVLSVRKPKNKVFYQREGFVITALGWIFISLMGCLPFVFSGAIPNFVDALFETVSGFTTTGASILSDVEALPKGILFWRSFTHWVGGMGVLVFLLIITPMSGGSHVNLMKAESPGPQVEKLVPKVQITAAILYGIYLAMTIIEVSLLLAGGMPLFDALTVSFGTAGTGGFGIKNDSIGGYSTYLQAVVTVFMILFGINFNFYFFLLLRKFSRAFAMEEVRGYLAIIIASILVITVNISNMFDSVLEAFHHAAFQVGSIITTTGFATTDFDLWPAASKVILVMLMFVGACAGSTGGGIKVSRWIILVRNIRKEFRHILHPQSVQVTMMDGKQVPHEVVRSINVFTIAYFMVFAISVLLISFDNQPLVTNFTAVAATLNNIGPGLELVGPTQNYSLFSCWSKIILIIDMLAGRLELFPVLLLFYPRTWRKF